MTVLTSNIVDFQLAKWEKQSSEIDKLFKQAYGSKQHLLQFIEYFFDPSEDEYREADFLVQSQRDIKKWLGIWRGDLFEGESAEDIREVNQLFRKWKAINNFSHFEEYKDLYYFDKQDWVETYFQQRYSIRCEEDLRTLSEMLNIEQIYSVHKKFPYSRIEYISNLLQSVSK